VRLTIIGGGGFRVPLVYGALGSGRGAAGSGGWAVDEVALYDVSAGRVAAIERVLAGMAGPPVVVTSDLDAALAGAAYVFCAVRVGGLRGRTVDERVALDLGLLGQETAGAGGVAYGLRSVPVMVRIAERIAAVAPDAWTIDFTNPVGMVTEAMSAVLGDRVIGICDSPVGMFRRVAWLLGVPPERVWFDYAGLNHLGWLTAAYLDGRDRLPGLLADAAAVGRIEEGRLFGADWLRTLGAIPNEYLYYYYSTREAIEAVRARGSTRGEYLARQQAAFYARVAADHASPDPGPACAGWAAAEWARVRAEREATYLPEARRDAAGAEEPTGGGYEQVALAVMRALAGGPPATLVLNTRNRRALAGLDPAAVVEVPCLVDANGAHPLVAGLLPEHARGLVTAVKAVDRAAIEAALTGSRDAAVRALALHPLVDSVALARRLLDGYAAGHPELAHLARPATG
jgi:6-phospho-beta-glucosidase